MKIRRNIFLFKLNGFFSELWPLSALAIVYFEQITGSYAIALGVFAIANIMQSFMEVPTGVLSDRMGRKNTMITASGIIILSFAAFAYAGNTNSIWLLNLGGIFWGIAEAFDSGTSDALMYETMEQLRKEKKYDVIYAQTKMFSQIGLASGALIAAVVTYFYSLNVLAWVAVVLSLGQLLISFFFVEPDKKYAEPEAENSWKHFLTAFSHFTKNRKLQLLSLLQISGKATGYAAHRMEGVYFNMLIPTWLVNITRIIKQSTGAISFYLMKYLRNMGFYRILVISSYGNVLIRFLGLILNNVATPFIMSFVNIFYGMETTSQSTLMQKELSSQQRATMGSIISMVGGLFSAAVYYLIGMIADVFNIYIAMLLLICSKAVLGYLYSVMLRKYAD